MQKILIIGNGFDLHHHLPTKYENFIDVLRTIETCDLSLADFSFNEIFKEINLEYKNQIINSYNTDLIKYPKEVIRKIQSEIKTNSWYQTFKNIKEIDTWIDFESQIENILNMLNKLFEKSKQVLEKYLSMNELWIFCEGEQTNNVLIQANHFQLLVFFKIIVYNKKDLSIISPSYCLFEANSIYAINEKKILADLSNSLNQFINIFNLYFTDIIQPFYDNYKALGLIKDKQSKNMQILTSLNTSSFPNDVNFNFIYSFNYTPTLFEYYHSEKINYIHGRIGSEHNMVLGISDINDELKKHKMFAFTKYYQKLYKNTDYIFLEKKMLPENDDFNIYIWGHSLDQSDGQYIKVIFELLEDNRYHLIIFYHDNFARASQLQNLLSICGQSTIERVMKSKQLVFQESTNENLSQMINI